MDILLSTFLGLSFRLLVNAVSSENARVVGMVIGLWEGVGLHHLSRSSSLSSAYIAYGLRIALDLILADSFSRIWLIVLWTALGMLISDAVSPSHWYDTTKHIRGLHRTRGRHDRIHSLHKLPYPGTTITTPERPSQTRITTAPPGSAFTKTSLRSSSRDVHISTNPKPYSRSIQPDSTSNESSHREHISRPENSDHDEPTAENNTRMSVDAGTPRLYLRSNISAISSTETSSQESTSSESVSEEPIDIGKNILPSNAGSPDELPTQTETRWLMENPNNRTSTSSDTQSEDPSISPGEDDPSPPLPHILRAPLPVSDAQDIPRRTVSSSIASSLLDQSLIPNDADDTVTFVEPLPPETTALITAVHEDDGLASPESSMQSLRLTESDVESASSVEGPEHWQDEREQNRHTMIHTRV